MGFFGEFQVRIDPWQAEYGPDLAADSEAGDARESVIEDVDVPRWLWRPILPTSAVLPRALVFVDGVRASKLVSRFPGRLGSSMEPLARTRSGASTSEMARRPSARSGWNGLWLRGPGLSSRK